jgi:hypothetical protein
VTGDVDYSNSNLSIAITSGDTGQHADVRTVAGHSSGAWYWEVTATGGVSTTDGGGLGIANSSFPNDALYVGGADDSLGFGYGPPHAGTWWYSWPSLSVSSDPPPANSAVATGIVYMLALDLDTGDFWAGQDGTWYNGGDPATGADPVATGITGTIYAAAVLYNGSQDAFTANFGASIFAYDVPTGFTPGF